MRARAALVCTVAAVTAWLAALLALAAGWSSAHIDAYALLLAASVALTLAAISLWLAVTPREAFRLGHAAGQRDGRRHPLVRVPVVFLPDRRGRHEQVEQDRRN